MFFASLKWVRERSVPACIKKFRRWYRLSPWFSWFWPFVFRVVWAGEFEEFSEVEHSELGRSVCEPHSWTCVDEFLSAQCNAAGTGYSGSISCDNMYGTECHEPTGLCVICEPDEYVCYDQFTSAICNSTGTGYSGGTSCDNMYGTECHEPTGRCIVCEPYEYECTDQYISGRCNGTGTGYNAYWSCDNMYGTECNEITGRCFLPMIIF